VGDKTYTTVGDKIHATVGDRTQSTVGDKIHATVGNKTHTTVGDKTLSNVGDITKCSPLTKIMSTEVFTFLKIPFYNSQWDVILVSEHIIGQWDLYIASYFKV
jgi:hypothetical protein